MRCKKHPCDYSSSVGVCATCLRDRLSALIAAQAQAHHQQAQLPRPQSRASSAVVLDDTRKSDSHHHPAPPPLVFPRSVSPYVTRRKSDEVSSWSASNLQHLRFYSTPQVGPTYNSAASSAPVTTSFGNTRSFGKKPSRFSLFSNLFRTRSEKLNPDPACSGTAVFSGDSTGPTSTSPSWFTTILSGRRKKQSRLFSVEHSGGTVCRHRRTMDRGMSPVRGADSDVDCEDCDRSPSGSGTSSDSSQGWKKTPVGGAAAVGRRGKAGHSRNVSGLAFCLSPLVRASPNRHWNSHKGGLPPDLAFTGEVRVQVKPQVTNAASFCKNRSRKLADFGRANRNR